MLEAPILESEVARLRSLQDLHILDSPAEGRFDRITRLARRIFDVPISAVSLIDSERQWFKSIDGLCVRETPRDISFCGHAIHAEQVFVVENALEDERFADNPLVTGEPHIRFYAGHPLSGPSGMIVGTLCIIDREPRRLTDNDSLILHDLAALVENELNLKRMSLAQGELMRRLETAQRQAMIDPLTQFWNRAGLTRILESEVNRAERQRSSLSVVMADIDHFKSINDTHGHACGDEVLREVARRMRTVLRASDACGRVGGEEFVVVHPSCEEEVAARIAERIRIVVAGDRFDVSGTGDSALGVTISLGVACSEPGTPIRPEKLLEAADQALYAAKKAGRNRVERAPATARLTVEGSGS